MCPQKEAPVVSRRRLVPREVEETPSTSWDLVTETGLQSSSWVSQCHEVARSVGDRGSGCRCRRVRAGRTVERERSRTGAQELRRVHELLLETPRLELTLNSASAVGSRRSTPAPSARKPVAVGSRAAASAADFPPSLPPDLAPLVAVVCEVALLGCPASYLKQPFSQFICIMRGLTAHTTPSCTCAVFCLGPHSQTHLQPSTDPIACAPDWSLDSGTIRSQLGWLGPSHLVGDIVPEVLLASGLVEHALPALFLALLRLALLLLGEPPHLVGTKVPGVPPSSGL
eukprot:scaffold55389_cov63-Phaeocystis_antarctica.AAC.1